MDGILEEFINGKKPEPPPLPGEGVEDRGNIKEIRIIVTIWNKLGNISLG